MPIRSSRFTAIACLALLAPLSGNAAEPSTLEDCNQVTKDRLIQCKDGAAYTQTRVDLSTLIPRKSGIAATQDGVSAKGDYKRILTLPGPVLPSKVSLNADDSILTEWRTDSGNPSTPATTLVQRDARTLSTLSTKSWPENVVALSPDGKRVLFDRGNKVFALVDVGTNRELATIPGSDSQGFSLDSRWLAVSSPGGSGDDGFQRFYSADTGALQMEILGAGRAAFSPSGTYVAIAALGDYIESSDVGARYISLRVYEIATRRLIREHDVRTHGVIALRFRPDERTVIADLKISEPTQRFGTVVWDWPTGQETLIDCCHHDVMTDGRFLRYEDQRIVVWDAKTAVPIDAFAIKRTASAVAETFVSTAGKRIVVTTRDTTTGKYERQVWERVSH